MPGSGKTTIGSALASHLQLPFADLDALIEAEEGQAIPRIFEERGEGYFRQLESEILHRVLHNPRPMVLATGGGTPCYFDNIDYIRQNSTSIYLAVSWQELAARLAQQPGKRPLLAQMNEDDFAAALQEKFSWRTPFYRQAHYFLAVEEYDSIDELLEHIWQLLLADS